jgi:hypothetical protein
MTTTEFSISRIGDEDPSVALDFLFHRLSVNENINTQDDRKFHGLSEYVIIF